MNYDKIKDDIVELVGDVLLSEVAVDVDWDDLVIKNTKELALEDHGEAIDKIIVDIKRQVESPKKNLSQRHLIKWLEFDKLKRKHSEIPTEIMSSESIDDVKALNELGYAVDMELRLSVAQAYTKRLQEALDKHEQRIHAKMTK